MNTIKTLLANWKTTSSGIIAIIGGVTLYLHDHTQITGAITAIMTGIGLLAAADGVTTQS